MHRLILVVAFIAAVPTLAWAQNDDPFPAHRVMGNLFFVGTAGLGTFLIATPEGHILINTDFERTIPLIERSVEAMGFDLEDVRVRCLSMFSSPPTALFTAYPPNTRSCYIGWRATRILSLITPDSWNT